MRIGKTSWGRIAAGRAAAGYLAVFLLGAAFWTNSRAIAQEKIYQPDLANCAGFTVKDAAPLLGVPVEKVTRTANKVHATLWMCSFSAGQPGKLLAFSIEVAMSAKAAAADMERYRDNLEVAAETAPFKNKLPKGAYSEILGDGLGDENVWTDVNGAFTARKGNVTVQVPMPADKLGKIDVGKAVLSKF
jgi:hypothetical protein